MNIFCYQIAREVLDAAARMIRPGVTTDEIDRVVHEATIAAGLCLLGFTVLFESFGKSITQAHHSSIITLI